MLGTPDRFRLSLSPLVVKREDRGSCPIESVTKGLVGMRGPNKVSCGGAIGTTARTLVRFSGQTAVDAKGGDP